MSEFQREQHGKQKTCVSCLHTRCLFYGENRLPIYNGAAGKTNCWDNANTVLGVKSNSDERR